MAAVCDICGKKPSFGMNVSHSHRRTKRRWDPNIQRVRALVNGAPKRLHVCTSCIRAGKVTKPLRRTHARAGHAWSLTVTDPPPRRTLIVGASSGIGRALARQCLARGDAVVVAARRTAPLDELIAESPQPTLGLAAGCDTTDPDACAGLVRAAVVFLEPHGGLDTVIYAAGTAPLGALSATTVTQWHELLATNLVGAALVVAEAIPELRRRRPGQAAVALLSSHIVGDPWPGLVAYAASKAGVNELARGLRAEEPSVRTLRISVGPTVTSFADGWDPETATVYLTRWFEEGQLRHDVLSPEETAGAMLRALDDPASPDDLTVIGAEAT